MKKTTLFLSLIMMSVAAQNALAVSYSMDYWTPSHPSAFFAIELEGAAYESDFGLFAYEAPDNRFKILDKTNEAGAVQNVYFQYLSGWEVSLDKTNWARLGEQFGFYYGVYKGGKNDATVDYYWYTDKQYNQYADGVLTDNDTEHVRTILDDSGCLVIELDDQWGGGDRDWDDMTVTGHNIQPVPEPGTMLLLGIGMIGFSGIGRKKMFRK